MTEKTEKTPRISAKRQLYENSRKWRPNQVADDWSDEPPKATIKRKQLPKKLKEQIERRDLSETLWVLLEQHLTDLRNGTSNLGEDLQKTLLIELRRMEELKADGKKTNDTALLEWLNSVAEWEDGASIETPGVTRGKLN